LDEVLARRDRHQITVEGLTPAARAAAEAALEAAGARILGIAHPRQSLDELFRQLVTGSRD
jgi:hypothetical protein